MSIKLNVDMIRIGKPMPDFLKLLQKQEIPKNWDKLERYLSINDLKINKSFPNNEQLCEYDDKFTIGIIFQKIKEHIKFTTYELLLGKCVLRHESVHSLEGNLKCGKINLYGEIVNFQCYDGTDGDNYVEQTLRNILIEKNFQWDLICSDN